MVLEVPRAAMQICPPETAVGLCFLPVLATRFRGTSARSRVSLGGPFRAASGASVAGPRPTVRGPGTRLQREADPGESESAKKVF